MTLSSRTELNWTELAVGNFNTNLKAKRRSYHLLMGYLYCELQLIRQSFHTRGANIPKFVVLKSVTVLIYVIKYLQPILGRAGELE